MQTEKPKHETLADLLEIVWRGIDADFKSRYRVTIWEQFENAVRAAAYTNNLGKFVNNLCAKLSAQLGADAEQRLRAQTILNAGADKALLKLAREETTYVVLLVRVRNQDRRDAYEARQAGLNLDTPGTVENP